MVNGAILNFDSDLDSKKEHDIHVKFSYFSLLRILELLFSKWNSSEIEICPIKSSNPSDYQHFLPLVNIGRDLACTLDSMLADN